MRFSLLFAVAAGIGSWAAGCAVEDLDLEGRSCPCLDGWRCDETSRLCVRDGTPDGGAAPMDGGPTPGVDGGPMSDVDGGSIPGVDGGPLPGVDGGPPRTRDTTCDGPLGDRMFCDGFEDSDFGPWDGIDANAGGTVDRVSDVVYRGRYAMRAQGSDDGNYAVAYKELFPTTPPSDQWFRAYYYFPDATGFPVEVQAMSDPDVSYILVVGAFPGNENFHGHGYAGDVWEGSSLPIPADTWTCVELHVAFSATDGVVELYLDDELAASATGLDTTAPLGLTTIAAGLVWQEPDDPPRTVYVDEVVADTARIGCD